MDLCRWHLAARLRPAPSSKHGLSGSALLPQLCHQQRLGPEHSPPLTPFNIVVLIKVSVLHQCLCWSLLRGVCSLFVVLGRCFAEPLACSLAACLHQNRLIEVHEASTSRLLPCEPLSFRGALPLIYLFNHCAPSAPPSRLGFGTWLMCHQIPLEDQRLS